MRRTFLIASVPAVLGAMLAGILSAGKLNVLVLFAAMLFGVYTLPFAGLAVLAILWLRRKQENRPPWREHLGGLLLAWCLFVVLVGAAWIAGNEVLGWRIERAKRQAGATIAQLEAYREANGRYPDSATLPPLMERWGGYDVSEDGQSYELHIEDPGALFFGWWYYESERGEWVYDD